MVLLSYELISKIQWNELYKSIESQFIDSPIPQQTTTEIPTTTETITMPIIENTSSESFLEYIKRNFILIFLTGIAACVILFICYMIWIRCREKRKQVTMRHKLRNNMERGQIIDGVRYGCIQINDIGSGVC